MEEFLKAVSAMNDESRVRIITFFMAYGSCCVCELEASLAMAQSTLSRHLKILKDAGFLRIAKVGARSYYEIAFASSLQESLAAEVKALAILLPSKIDAENTTRCKILGK